MKKIIAFLVFLCGVWIVRAQTADEIIEKYIQAMGGREKLELIQASILEGKVQAMKQEIPIKFTSIKEKGYRMDMEIMGMKLWTIATPDTGWTYMPMQGAPVIKPMPKEVIAESRSQFYPAGPLLDYKKIGLAIEYLGMDDVDGKDCYKLKSTSKEGKISYFLIDPTTNYLVRVSAKKTIMGKEMEIVTDFSDFRKLESGTVFPHKMISPNGEVQVIKITINPDIDEKILVPPTN